MTSWKEDYNSRTASVPGPVFTKCPLLPTTTLLCCVDSFLFSSFLFIINNYNIQYISCDILLWDIMNKGGCPKNCDIHICLIHINIYVCVNTSEHRIHPVGSEADESLRRLNTTKWSNGLRRQTSCRAIGAVQGSDSHNVHSIYIID